MLFGFYIRNRRSFTWKNKGNNKVSLEEKKLELALSPFGKSKEIEGCMRKKKIQHKPRSVRIIGIGIAEYV
jgi:hypothetical protein